MRILGCLLAIGLAAATAGASTPMNPSFSAQPSSVNNGQTLTLAVQVSNTGASQLFGVSSSVQAYGSGGASATLLATPVPFSASVPAYGSAAFTWVFSASGCGSVSFSLHATGYNTGSGLTETAGPVDSNLISVTCYTATPSPTASPTPTVTPSPTYWIVYATATPAPLFGDANIPGNLFHPDLGQPLQLHFSAPLEGKVQIDLYNRIGGHVRHFERSVDPGSYTELWDGRDEEGVLVASGIYVAQFKAKGLFKTVKFAVVK